MKLQLLLNKNTVYYSLVKVPLKKNVYSRKCEQLMSSMHCTSTVLFWLGYWKEGGKKTVFAPKRENPSTQNPSIFFNLRNPSVKYVLLVTVLFKTCMCKFCFFDQLDMHIGIIRLFTHSKKLVFM